MTARPGSSGGMDGVEVLPDRRGIRTRYLRRHPDDCAGRLSALPGRYQLDPVPYAQSWKRIALRSGFEPADQYLVLDGMQGLEWSYDDINAIVRYDDLGQTLLKSQWDARSVESRLEMNTLLVSSGTPGAKQSVAAGWQRPPILVPRRSWGAGPPATMASPGRGTCSAQERLVPGGRRGPARNGGDHFLAQTWLSWHPFTVHGAEAMAQARRRDAPRRRHARAAGFPRPREPRGPRESGSK